MQDSERGESATTGEVVQIPDWLQVPIIRKPRK